MVSRRTLRQNGVYFMNANSISGDMINFRLRQLGATSIREINSIMHIVRFQLENGFEVAYVFNITKNNKYFLQRMRPYALAHGKMADAESIVAFITEDIAKFRQAQRSSNFHTFIETASLMNTLTAKLEELFLNNNVDGKLLTNFTHCIQNECDYVDALIDNSKPL